MDYRKEIKTVLEVLQAGGTILYPTDTIWGLGCDATNEQAVRKVRQIKGRSEGKAMIILLDSPNRLPSYVRDIPDIAWDLIDLAVKPLTIIYEGAKNLAPSLTAEDGSVGVRISHDPFVQELIFRLRKPLVSTSANFSGSPSPGTFDAIDPVLLEQADYTVQWRQEELSGPAPSSIIRIGPGGVVEIIRQ